MYYSTYNILNTTTVNENDIVSIKGQKRFFSTLLFEAAWSGVLDNEA